MLPQPLIIERTIKAPADLVWKSLTDINLLKQWLPFFPDFKAKVGYEVRFALGRDPDHQYTHIVKVLEVEVGKKLSYTWKYDGFAGDSFVTYEIFPDGSQTKLKLTHTITEEFPDNPDFALKNFAEGWGFTADAVKKFAENLKN